MSEAAHLMAGADGCRADGGDDAAVGREAAAESAWQGEKDNCCDEHEGRAGEDAAPTGGGGGLWLRVAGADAA